jgi:hypothetical protein
MDPLAIRLVEPAPLLSRPPLGVPSSTPNLTLPCIDLASPRGGQTLSLVRVSKTKTVAAGTQLIRLDDIMPPVLTAVTFEPPLPADLGVKARLNGVSVSLQDMLAVPEWTEARSAAGRMILELIETPSLPLRGPSGPHHPHQSSSGLFPFIDQARYDSISLVLSAPAPQETVVRTHGVNVCKEQGGEQCLVFS